MRPSTLNRATLCPFTRTALGLPSVISATMATFVKSGGCVDIVMTPVELTLVLEHIDRCSTLGKAQRSLGEPLAILVPPDVCGVTRQTDQQLVPRGVAFQQRPFVEDAR